MLIVFSNNDNGYCSIVYHGRMRFRDEAKFMHHPIRFGKTIALGFPESQNVLSCNNLFFRELKILSFLYCSPLTVPGFSLVKVIEHTGPQIMEEKPLPIQILTTTYEENTVRKTNTD